VIYLCPSCPSTYATVALLDAHRVLHPARVERVAPKPTREKAA